MGKQIYLLGLLLLLLIMIIAPDALAAQTQSFATGQNASNLDNSIKGVTGFIKMITFSLLGVGILVAAIMWAVGKLEWAGYVAGAAIIASVGTWFIGGMMDSANQGAGATSTEYVKTLSQAELANLTVQHVKITNQK